MGKWSKTGLMPTPWGTAQTQRKLADGIYHVTTASHGGYMIGKRIAEARLSEPARKAGMQWSHWLCYEEDCKWAVLANEVDEVLQSRRLDRTPHARVIIERHMRALLAQYEPEYLAANGEDNHGTV